MVIEGMQTQILSTGLSREDKRPREMIVQEQLLHYLESAYPNILPTDDLLEWVTTRSQVHNSINPSIHPSTNPLSNHSYIHQSLV